MINSGKLAGKTLFITGASRGIGKAIALKAAKDGANIIIAAKTADPHPKLPGTIYTAAKEIEEAGGKSLPCIVDVRDEKQIIKAVEEGVKKFGGIDIVVNNASAISLTPTTDTDMKRYDLMHNINTRGTFLVSKICIPYLKKSSHAHILNLSPPLNMNPVWFKNHLAYTMAKYGMSMCVLGMADELREDKIAVNALWPRSAIYTAAIEMLAGKESGNTSRKPEIMADAAYAILCKSVDQCTGKFLVDDEVLRAEGVTDLKQYAVNPDFEDKLMLDFFLDAPPNTRMSDNVTPSKKSESSSGAGATGGSDIEQIFNAINSNLGPELVQKTQAVFQFKIKTPEGEEVVWFVDLKSGTGAVGKGDPSSKADATLTMSNKDFLAIFTGKMKASSAFMLGRLKIAGNMQKAMKLEKLMGGLKSKM